MVRFTRTWWGKRFLEALEQFTDEGRLSRGRSYAHNGRIVEHALENGTVEAKVRGSINPYYGVYKEPIYRTTITITQIPADRWGAIIDRIAARADLIAKLLQQEMPDQIEEVFTAEGLHLLPHSRQDFLTDCSCPDWDNPCKHIAGVYYLLAADLDHDPFLLFQLRGLSQDALLTGLATSPLGKILASTLAPEERPTTPAASFHTRPTREPAASEPAASEPTGSAASHRAFWAGARRLPPAAPSAPARVPALLVKKQGDYPAFWPKDASFIATMEELYERIRTKSPQLK